ncbi:1-deoxy-D-xylulose-5-phosphate reductoisomerase [Bacillus carboniphilus]|uniref:1-deoxy-D-xylulose 5-phosphate reductoisomerase n=1 Tax=Bacillus carboniphilus TaxID=86663 RepID=A0ABY9JVS4_9BACI|nr:1-deoxy-D-xylulose-5-phosphate reductoisomerase [Bacillus carboniphilus]WLR43511.1 1-deoxy-D-xylulose-5-phosphate reductoisomerase [Bacillus carboniphilus]
MKKISLLGATGSIGLQTLDVIREHKNDFTLVALSFGTNIKEGLKIIEEFRPSLVAVKDKETYDKINIHVPHQTRVVWGIEGNVEVAIYEEATIVVNSVVGSVGLMPTLKAIEAKKDVAIANKETLVVAGHLVTEAAKVHNVKLLPIDSEHSAILQALQGENKKSIEKLIVTASGGSFRDKTRAELKGVTVNEALNHPNWSMGAKITIDSATMMNKGFEVIEAHWLFDISYDKIDVLLHKESIIHSMIQFHDGSVMAQLGTPDMKVPIQYALTYPERKVLSTKRLDLWQIGSLHFDKVNGDRFRCLHFAYESGKIGGTMPVVLNAANEIAVQAFLQGEIEFLEIETLIEHSLNRHQVEKHPSLSTILNVDKDTRLYVRSLIK